MQWMETWRRKRIFFNLKALFVLNKFMRKVFLFDLIFAPSIRGGAWINNAFVVTVIAHYTVHRLNIEYANTFSSWVQEWLMETRKTNYIWCAMWGLDCIEWKADNKMTERFVAQCQASKWLLFFFFTLSFLASSAHCSSVFSYPLNLQAFD